MARELTELDHEVLQAKDGDVHRYVGWKQSISKERLGSFVNPKGSIKPV